MRSVTDLKPIKTRRDQALLVMRDHPSDEITSTKRRPPLRTGPLEAVAAGNDLSGIALIWLFALTSDDRLIAERVLYVRYWKLINCDDDMSVSALLCESGRIYVVSEDDLYLVDETTSSWVSARMTKEIREQ